MTAFLSISDFRKYAADIAWETEVWIAATPDHMIHFNGPKCDLDHAKGSAPLSCSERVDETVYLFVLFSRRRSFEGQRSGVLFPARRPDGTDRENRSLF